ncbi:unnamed protein product [Thlaspi arvense]|uniref:DUF8040 domain-containing protein n=1 Tax=Thlaspi arvense TaxID=13288 RepID=A0AAU9S1G8_THLAR|nr:unnamed protein product [Thlaspi arvense]
MLSLNMSNDGGVEVDDDASIRRKNVEQDEKEPMDKSVPEIMDNAADDSNNIRTSDCHLSVHQSVQTESSHVSLHTEVIKGKGVSQSREKNIPRRRKSFETEINGHFKEIMEFRRVQATEAKERREKNEAQPYKEAYGIFQSVQGLTKWTYVWWACVKVLKEDPFAREMMRVILDMIVYGSYIGNCFKTLQSCNGDSSSVNLKQNIRNIEGGIIENLAIRLNELYFRGLENLTEEELLELYELEDEEFMNMIMQPLLEYYQSYFFKQPMTFEQGIGWLNLENQIQCLVRCMSMLLQRRHHLRSTDHISVDEMVAMFLVTCAQNDTQRYVGLSFGRFQETVYRKALDGTHVRVKAGGSDAVGYWDRHGQTSLNIISICDINMVFNRTCKCESVIAYVEENQAAALERKRRRYCSPLVMFQSVVVVVTPKH